MADYRLQVQQINDLITAYGQLDGQDIQRLNELETKIQAATQHAFTEVSKSDPSERSEGKIALLRAQSRLDTLKSEKRGEQAIRANFELFKREHGYTQ